MKSIQQGFTLIELMIVIAIIGILASVAIPQYQDYTSRAVLTGCLAEVGGGKVAVDDLFYRNGSTSAINVGDIGFNGSTCASFLTTGQGTNNNPTIEGTTGPIASLNGDGAIIILTRDNTDSSWACTVSDDSNAAITVTSILPRGCVSI
jgi:type IV pilus assembly protein PilA